MTSVGHMSKLSFLQEPGAKRRSEAASATQVPAEVLLECSSEQQHRRGSWRVTPSFRSVQATAATAASSLASEKSLQGKVSIAVATMCSARSGILRKYEGENESAVKPSVARTGRMFMLRSNHLD